MCKYDFNKVYAYEKGMPAEVYFERYFFLTLKFNLQHVLRSINMEYRLLINYQK